MSDEFAGSDESGSRMDWTGPLLYGWPDLCLSEVISDHYISGSQTFSAAIIFRMKTTLFC